MRNGTSTSGKVNGIGTKRVMVSRPRVSGIHRLSKSGSISYVPSGAPSWWGNGSLSRRALTRGYTSLPDGGRRRWSYGSSGTVTRTFGSAPHDALIGSRHRVGRAKGGLSQIMQFRFASNTRFERLVSASGDGCCGPGMWVHFFGLRDKGSTWTTILFFLFQGPSSSLLYLHTPFGYDLIVEIPRVCVVTLGYAATVFGTSRTMSKSLGGHSRKRSKNINNGYTTAHATTVYDGTSLFNFAIYLATIVSKAAVPVVPPTTTFLAITMNNRFRNRLFEDVMI